MASDPGSAFEQGNRLAKNGQLDQAEAAYRSADEAGHPTAAACVGIFEEQRGNASKALEAYQRADARGDRFGAFRLGMLLSSHGDWPAANEAWKRADERGSDYDLDLVALLRHRDTEDRQLAVPAGARSPFANPVLVGAVTVLVLMVAVFLAYNANAGLPFVPTKELKVDVADGSQLVIGNDVREGGFRIGLVSDMKPVELPNGQVGAQLILHLDKNRSSIPVDSSATILPRSVLGLKYVEINVGTSKKTFADGATMPISQTSVPVQFDDIFKTFDHPTRTAIQKDLVGFGDTLTARGSALNDTIASLPQLLFYLRPVAQYLAAPNTELIRFLRNLNGFMGTLAPVAPVAARLFTDAATTFAAITRDPNAYEATIAESPSTLDVSTNSLITQQPFLTDLTTLGRDLTPGTSELRSALPAINPAIEAGTSTLRRAPALNQKLQQTLQALKTLAISPGTNIALNALTSTTTTLNPMVRYLGPFQTVCDDWNYWWTYLAEHISEATTFGFAQRALFAQSNPLQLNNVNDAGASEPVNGGGFTTPFGGNEFLHSQNYGAAIDNQGNADCETGQRGYPMRLNGLDPQHRNLALDPHTPGDQGPTYHGRARVPAGETFSRNPSTGPQLPYEPSNP
jgi:virulence factor Mce-like protein